MDRMPVNSKASGSRSDRNNSSSNLDENEVEFVDLTNDSTPIAPHSGTNLIDRGEFIDLVDDDEDDNEPIIGRVTRSNTAQSRSIESFSRNRNSQRPQNAEDNDVIISRVISSSRNHEASNRISTRERPSRIDSPDNDHLVAERIGLSDFSMFNDQELAITGHLLRTTSNSWAPITSDRASLAAASFLNNSSNDQIGGPRRTRGRSSRSGTSLRSNTTQRHSRSRIRRDLYRQFYENILLPLNEPEDDSYEELVSLQSRLGSVRRGLTTANIKNLPQVKFGSSGEASGHASTCSICLGDYRKNQVLIMLPQCMHKFHKACISKWLKQNKTCPMCRVAVNIDS